ncbi:MAG: hypothetical protein NT007_15425 [Candidatus Kapabacteria bacterium]|nr:hypothetical protein [Candidatus Kapabacteria bacterium]
MTLSATNGVRDLILTSKSQCGLLRFATSPPPNNGGYWSPGGDRECMRITPLGYVGIGFNNPSNILETRYNNPNSIFDVQLHPWYNSTRIAYALTGQRMGSTGTGFPTIRIYNTADDETCFNSISNNFCAAPFWLESKRVNYSTALQIKSTTNNYAPGDEDDNSNESIMKSLFTVTRAGNVGIGSFPLIDPQTMLHVKNGFVMFDGILIPHNTTTILPYSLNCNACARIIMLENKIDTLTRRLDSLINSFSKIERDKGDKNTLMSYQNFENIILDQNNPNPFSESTQINFYIPNCFKGKAKLIFSDEYGGQKIKNWDIIFGKPSQITISAKDLTTGIYIYGIEIDGVLIKSKKMMIIK